MREHTNNRLRPHGHRLGRYAALATAAGLAGGWAFATAIGPGLGFAGDRLAAYTAIFGLLFGLLFPVGLRLGRALVASMQPLAPPARTPPAPPRHARRDAEPPPPADFSTAPTRVIITEAPPTPYNAYDPTD